MKVQKILIAMMAVDFMTIYSMEEVKVVSSIVVETEENDTCFGDAYEEDGCYCN